MAVVGFKSVQMPQSVTHTKAVPLVKGRAPVTILRAVEFIDHVLKHARQNSAVMSGILLRGKVLYITTGLDIENFKQWLSHCLQVAI